MVRWRHCAGALNPADLPSRGQSLIEFVNNKRWFDGPDWLLTMEEPATKKPLLSMPHECLAELRKTPAPTPVLVSQADTKLSVSCLIEIQRFSDVERLWRVTAYVLLFPESLQKTDSSSRMSTQWLEKAERLWVKAAQADLRSDSKYETSWKAQLGVFEDNNGLLRCRGRLKNSRLPYAVQFPLILPTNHYLTTLLIRQAHERVCHNGVKETLTQLRSRYWVIKGRSC